MDAQPKPMGIDDLVAMIGHREVVIESLRRQIASLREELARAVEAVEALSVGVETK